MMIPRHYKADRGGAQAVLDIGTLTAKISTPQDEDTQHRIFSFKDAYALDTHVSWCESWVSRECFADWDDLAKDLFVGLKRALKEGSDNWTKQLDAILLAHRYYAVEAAVESLFARNEGVDVGRLVAETARMVTKGQVAQAKLVAAVVRAVAVGIPEEDIANLVKGRS